METGKETRRRTAESALLILLMSAGFRVRIGMKYGGCGFDMAAGREPQKGGETRGLAQL